jgi:hypothetical protein
VEQEFAQSLVQQVLPSYRVGDLLGEGSSGAVFRIRDNLKERAVKIVPLSASASVADGAVVSAANRVERDFRHIVESYERLACDEIVTVYDFYKVPGGEDRRLATAYAVVVMELYPANLHDFVIDHFEREGGRLPAPTAQRLLEQLARLLEDLYTKRGFLLEDIKPENILIRENRGELKVVVGDIGGLKNLGSLSTTGTQVTLTYCAPEVIRCGRKPDLRSIIYSYGLLASFVLEGHLPYDHAGASERIELLREKGLPRERADLPPHLLEVVERCLAFEAAERFEDFHEVGEALRHGIQARKDRFSGDTVDLDSFMQRAGGAGGAAAAPAAAAPGGFTPAAAPGRPAMPAELTRGLRGGLGPLGIQQPRRRVDGSQVASDRQAMGQATREIGGLRVKRGETFKIPGDCRVLDDIVVEADAILVVENVKVFFAENAGIVSRGTLRAKNATFTAADPVRRWKNIGLFPAAARVSIFENCVFRYARGRTWGDLREELGLTGGGLVDGYAYGGGLFVKSGGETGVTVQGCTFAKCRAQYGGGACAIGGRPVFDACTFDGCAATLAGGGLYCEGAAATVTTGRFVQCSAEKGGGGVGCTSSPLTLENCSFEACTTSRAGGGVWCTDSAPTIQRCKFSRCTAAREAGGIWWDEASRPRTALLHFSGCTPADTSEGRR